MKHCFIHALDFTNNDHFQHDSVSAQNENTANPLTVCRLCIYFRKNWSSIGKKTENNHLNQ